MHKTSSRCGLFFLSFFLSMIKLKYLKKLKSNPSFSRKLIRNCITSNASWQLFLKRMQNFRVSQLLRVHDVKKNRLLFQKKTKVIYGNSSISKGRRSLSYVLWRLRFFPSRLSAKKAILRGIVFVNNFSQRDTLFQVKPGDLVYINNSLTSHSDFSFFLNVTKDVSIKANIFHGCEVSFSTKSFVVCYLEGLL